MSRAVVGDASTSPPTMSQPPRRWPLASRWSNDGDVHASLVRASVRPSSTRTTVQNLDVYRTECPSVCVTRRKPSMATHTRLHMDQTVALYVACHPRARVTQKAIEAWSLSTGHDSSRGPSRRSIAGRRRPSVAVARARARGRRVRSLREGAVMGIARRASSRDRERPRASS